MRQSALSEPTPQQDFEGDEVPQESLTRLVSARRQNAELAGETPGPEHTRPTTPVPSYYRFLAQHSEDETYAHVLAGRLVDLAEDAFDAAPRPASGGDGGDSFAEITRTRTIARRQSSMPPPIVRGMTSVLSSIARVPYLRRMPQDIALDTIEHSQAFVLALIDGRASIAEILDTSPMPVPQVLGILNDLLESGIISLRA